MKILNIGASGLVGGSLYKKLSNKAYILGTYNQIKIDNFVKLDIVNKDDVMKVVSDFYPDIIFLTAALTNVDLCEENKELCWRINVQGTRNVVHAANKIGAKLIFFSSDYVFDGKSGPYSEEDKINPINNYGKSKIEAENIIKELSDYLIIRTTVVYGNELQCKNFASRTIKSLREGKTVKAVVDQISTPTYVGDLADKVIILTKRKKKGIYNVAGPDLMSRYEFAKHIANVFNLDENLIVPVTTLELRQKAPRPLKAGLKTNKLYMELGLRTMSVIEGLEAMKNEQQ
ncbi:MAG: dTDP-4-dehydrorhamnose reductase [Candidatus Aenigmatarchaeota archaeon]